MNLNTFEKFLSNYFQAMTKLFSPCKVIFLVNVNVNFFFFISDCEPPAYVNLADLANMDRQREQSTDSDRTPTDKSPPDTQPVQV